MQGPEKQVVRAFITSIDNPDAHVLHRTGTEPIEVGSTAHSHEDLLHVLGQRVLQNGYLAIDYLKSRKNVSDPFRNAIINVAEVHAKPIDRSQITLAEGYHWSDY